MLTSSPRVVVHILSPMVVVHILHKVPVIALAPNDCSLQCLPRCTEPLNNYSRPLPSYPPPQAETSAGQCHVYGPNILASQIQVINKAFAKRRKIIEMNLERLCLLCLKFVPTTYLIMIIENLVYNYGIPSPSKDHFWLVYTFHWAQQKHLHAVNNSEESGNHSSMG
ncbi:hypothetical protein J6590_093318 [Homalodisca vitripennis]|nr:hypothetical protein J6590_093318 [Homalodisca vitripennis]